MCVVCVVSRNPFNRKKREERERERGREMDVVVVFSRLFYAKVLVTNTP